MSTVRTVALGPTSCWISEVTPWRRDASKDQVLLVQLVTPGLISARECTAVKKHQGEDEAWTLDLSGSIP
jgi:hypothetical protein